MSSNILLFDSGISSTVPSMKFTAGNDGTLIIQTTNAGGTPTTALTINNNQQITFVNAITPSTTNGIVGTTLADNAVAGSVGEYVSSTVNAPLSGLTSATQTNATSISLTAGDWDVSGTVSYNFGGSTVPTKVFSSVNTTSATIPSQIAGYSALIDVTQTAGDGYSAVAPPLRVNVTTTTTVYLVGYCIFTGGTAGIGGTIRARRVR